MAHTPLLLPLSGASELNIDGSGEAPSLRKVLRGASQLTAQSDAEIKVARSLVGASRLQGASLPARTVIGKPISGWSALVIDAPPTELIVGIEGWRISPPLQFPNIKRVSSSSISWESGEPEGTEIIISVSLDGGETWHKATNGGPIPGIEFGQSLEGVGLLVQQYLASKDPPITPVLYKVTIRVNEMAWVTTAKSIAGASGIEIVADTTRLYRDMALVGASQAVAGGEALLSRIAPLSGRSRIFAGPGGGDLRRRFWEEGPKADDIWTPGAEPDDFWRPVVADDTHWNTR